MNRHRLYKSVEIAGKEVPIDSDFRNIIQIFTIMDDPDLLETERLELSLEYFYDSDDYLADIEEAIKQMMYFITMGDSEESKASGQDTKLYDWEKDFNIIIAPINKILGYDVREKEYLHWWTFLSAFMEIGECTFNTYVGIRSKLAKGKKLEKYEEKILRENKDRIILKRKHDSTTQALMDEIMGV